MAIRITQPGEAAAAAQAGAVIGRGKRAEEERARAEREQARADQMAAQQAARKAALEWEQQKMLLNSQQDFAHEMRMRQADLEKEARAKEWATEKMEMASRFDFEQDEKERVRVKAEYAAGRDTLDKKKDDMPPGEYERALYRLDSIYAPKGVPDAVEGLGYKEQTIAQQRRELESIVGPEIGKFMPMEELQAEAARLGTTTEAIQAGEEMIPQPTISASLTAINPTTGERLISYDGGETWKPILQGGRFRGYGATGEF